MNRGLLKPVRQRAWQKIGIAAGLVAVVSLCAGRDAAGAAEQVFKPVKTGLHMPAFNPHLHGAAVVAPNAKAGRVHVPVVAAVSASSQEHGLMVHHPWVNGWDAAEWRAAHLKYGYIRGVVVDPSGAPVANAHVWLQHPDGHSFRTRPPKHATNTDAHGHFIMRQVLTGDYKLNTFGRKEWAKTGDHAEIQLAAGGVLWERLQLK